MKLLCLVILLTSSLSLSQEEKRLYLRQDVVNDLFQQQPLNLSGYAPRPDAVSYQEAEPTEKKSVALAAIYSLLLPGMGELYAGDYSLGKYFTIAEGVLWITLGAVEWHGNSLQDNARDFAVQHAAVSLPGKDDQYFVDIGNYNNTYSYNTAVSRAREYFKTYNAQSADAWQWDVDANRTLYRDLRVSSDEMFNNTKFIAGVIALNHLVSAINAGRIALAHNRSVERAGLIDLHASLIGTFAHPDGIMLSFTKHF